MEESSNRSSATPQNNQERANESQRKYAATKKGAETVKKYEASDKARARKRKYTYLMSPEQMEKQRKAKRLSAQRRREKLKQKNLVLGVDTLK